MFIVFAAVVIYVVYTYLYPSDDPSHVTFLSYETDARKSPIHLKKGGVTPPIFTGGDFTLSFWVYIDDWNFQAAKYKPLFNLGPMSTSGQSRSVLVGMLTPLQNGLMIRGATMGNSQIGPDITQPDQYRALLAGQTSQTMFDTTLDSPCDVKEVPLQRWCCVSIVSSGRVLDVYMNGKLSRSCVLESVLQIPIGPIILSLGTFGGRYSSVQMWNVQLTPDVIYGIYQMGPTQTQHNIITDVSKYLGVNVTFSGSTPGQANSAMNDPFASLRGAINTELPLGCNIDALASRINGQ
jgi:hypothetical protein